MHFFPCSVQRKGAWPLNSAVRRLEWSPGWPAGWLRGKSHHLSGLSGLHLFWLPWLKNGWGLSQGNRNHARCFTLRGYKTGNWLHRCWETGRTERGRRINPVINDCKKQLPLLGQEGSKGTCERGGGADASGAASVEETAPSRHSSGKSRCSHFHTHHWGRKERRKQKKP